MTSTHLQLRHHPWWREVEITKSQIFALPFRAISWGGLTQDLKEIWKENMKLLWKVWNFWKVWNCWKFETFEKFETLEKFETFEKFGTLENF